MNKLLGIGIFGLASWFILRMARAQNVSENALFSLVNPRIHLVNLAGISFRTEISVNNPTRDSLNLTKPVVSIWVNGKVLGQSVAENKQIQINPLSVSKVDTIELVLPWTALSKVVGSIITQVPALINAFKNKKLNQAFITLKSYIEGETKTLSINKAQLNGLMGIVNENLFAQKKTLNGTYDENGIVVNSEDLLKMEFETIGLQGKYRQLIGDPSVDFTAMVYGLPKSGKSTLCLDFANYLAAHHGKVLYCGASRTNAYNFA